VAAENAEPEYTEPAVPVAAPAPAPPSVRFTDAGEPRELPSFHGFVTEFGFDPPALTARQLDALLGFYLSKFLDVD
jgi:hypothetical protein